MTKPKAKRWWAVEVDGKIVPERVFDVGEEAEEEAHLCRLGTNDPVRVVPVDVRRVSKRHVRVCGRKK